MIVIPGSPAGHGSGSPKLHTVTLVVGAVLSFSRRSTTGTGVSPSATLAGMPGVAAPAKSAWAVPAASKVTAIGPTISDTTARNDPANLAGYGLLLVLTLEPPIGVGRNRGSQSLKEERATVSAREDADASPVLEVGQWSR